MPTVYFALWCVTTHVFDRSCINLAAERSACSAATRRNSLLPSRRYSASPRTTRSRLNFLFSPLQSSLSSAFYLLGELSALAECAYTFNLARHYHNAKGPELGNHAVSDSHLDDPIISTRSAKPAPSSFAKWRSCSSAVWAQELREKDAQLHSAGGNIG